MSKSLLQSSRLLSLVTFGSRITGLARDILIQSWLGLSWVQDSFVYAFAIPNMFRQLLGEGALSAAFIPIFSEKMTDQDRTSTNRLFGMVATILATVLIGLTLLVLAVIFSVWIFGQKDSERQLILFLTALMAPYMVFVCLVALFSALLNCLDRYGLPAFMPILLNIFQIAAVVFAKTILSRWFPLPQQQIYIIGLAVLLAGVTQLAIMIRAARRLGITWTLDFSFRDPDLRRIARMMGPMVFGLGILQFGAWLDNQVIVSLTAGSEESTFSLFGRTIRYPLAEGAMSAVNAARRLYMFPLGVLGIALATVAFPTFSRHAANKDYRSLADSISHAFRFAIFEGLPSGIGLIVLAPLIISVAFERGNFTADDTLQTAWVLRFYSLGIWAYCAHHIILRAFYSLKDTMTPLRIMGKTLTLAILMNITLLWIPTLREGVFGLSTSLMASVNVIILGWILSRRIGTINVREILVSASKTAIAGGLMALALILASNYLPIANKYLLLIVCLAIGLGVFFTAARLMKMPEAKELMNLRRRKEPAPVEPAATNHAQLMK